MIVVFLEEAQAEYLEAISYYEFAQSGLGRRFQEEVDRVVLWLANNPDLCRLRRKGYRRMNLATFPYYLPYIIRGETLWVLALAHSARRPEYWIGRSPQPG
jgi:plasmid stabilization system protein ParE